MTDRGATVHEHHYYPYTGKEMQRYVRQTFWMPYPFINMATMNANPWAVIGFFSNVFLFLMLLVVIILFETGVMPSRRNEPFFLTCDQTRIRSKSMTSTQTSRMRPLAIALFGVIVVLIPVVETFHAGNAKEKFHRWLQWSSKYVLGMCCTDIIYQVMKSTYAVPRMNHDTVCDPKQLAMCETNLISNHTIGPLISCKHPDPVFAFPSGFATLSVGFACFSSWYIYMRLHPALPKFIMMVILAIYALYESDSRTPAHTNSSGDVAAGSIIAILILSHVAKFHCKKFRV